MHSKLTLILYAGDRLNFGLAAEQAKGEGHKVALLVVGDDCSLPQNGPAARRGLAGSTLVIKARAYTYVCTVSAWTASDDCGNLSWAQHLSGRQDSS